MKRIFTVFGTRPEAIKMAPVIQALRRFNDQIQTVVCVTAQHREMLDQMMHDFAIVPDLDLDLMREDQSLPEVTASVMDELTKVYRKYRPDLILVQGDTTTAMVAVLAGFYEKIPVGHIEAGLRTNDRYYPFPEEINRRMVSVLSTYHFCPTQSAADALILENIPKDKIFVTGNTVVDALLSILKQKTPIEAGFPNNDRRIILVTAHRRETFGQPMVNICNALLTLVKNHPLIQVAFPVHLNPNVRKTVYQILNKHERITLLEPLDYKSFVHWMDQSYLILTDSGGIQEEATVLGKPVLVLRNETERVESVLKGLSRIIGTDQNQIIKATEKLLFDRDLYSSMAIKTYLYGDGKAAGRVAKVVLDLLGFAPP
jgi:UDP-N-acetylglucosamine 2-epimerase (non-hydrolysing)